MGEGYGTYAILKNSDASAKLYSNKIDMLELHNILELKTGETFYVIRKSSDVRLAVEGEVLMPESKKVVRVVDFYSKNANYITVIEFSPQHIFCYETNLVKFAALNLTGLKTGSRVKTYLCLNCHQKMEVKAIPFTCSVSCAHCGTHHLLNEETGRLTKNGRNSIDIQADIQIGSSGTINGITFDVIGYSQKEENAGEKYRWKEYVLYNRINGFAYLSEFEGHWIYVKESPLPPIVGKFQGQHFTQNGHDYSLYNNYSYEVVSAVGEHPYDISKTGSLHVREYIAPPLVWISEGNKKETNWFLGNHIESKTVLNSFTFPDHKPQKYGIGMVQPLGNMNTGTFFKVILAAILGLVGIHMFTALSKQEKIIMEQNYAFADSTSNETFVSPKFTLDKWKSNMEFHVTAPVDNNWFELSATLINADNGKEYAISKGVEYYSGYSDGERWTEGSTVEDAYLTDIPAGTYFLNLIGRRETGGFNRVSGFYVRVMYDVRTDRNLWFALLFLAVAAAIQYFIFYNYNKKRWSNSRYSPYTYEH